MTRSHTSHRLARVTEIILRLVSYLAYVVWGYIGGVALGAPPRSPEEIASRIDAHLSTRWKVERVTPSDQATDAAFVRRIYLDLIGRIPTVAESRNFINDKEPAKREKLTAQLVDSGAYARHAATFWRREWIPQADLPQSLLAEEIETWLASRIREGVPYNRIVHQLLTATASKTRSEIPTTFLTAGEYKPENLAANTMRAFLGINLDCAQCHNHPFSRWTRDQFWETAAFFARPTSAENIPAKLELLIPNSTKIISPRLLTDPQPDWSKPLTDETGRNILADWVTASNNSYFAKNAVNRMWANLFGTGLVEPLDDLSGENPASHPELLDELAAAFVESGFDLKLLTTSIVLTKSYQLSSVSTSADHPDVRLFARTAVRGLTGEQLYDSLRIAAGLPTEREDLNSPNVIGERRRFSEKFRLERTGTAQRSILQALSLMNGRLTAEFTSVENSPTLLAVAEAPFLDTHGKVETLFLAAFSRRPTTEELAEFVKYVEAGGADNNPRKALADIFWALLNSSEFNTNH